MKKVFNVKIKHTWESWKYKSIKPFLFWVKISGMESKSRLYDHIKTRLITLKIFNLTKQDCCTSNIDLQI